MLGALPAEPRLDSGESRVPGSSPAGPRRSSKSLSFLLPREVQEIQEREPQRMLLMVVWMFMCMLLVLLLLMLMFALTLVLM